MEINLDEIIRRFARLHLRIVNWSISRMNDSETKERGLLGVKIKKFPGGVYLQTPLEACTFSARFGNQSVFILDPRLSSPCRPLLISKTTLCKTILSSSFVLESLTKTDKLFFLLWRHSLPKSREKQ